MPDELRPIIGKRGIWKSYGTENFAEAKRRHPREMAAVEAQFADARRRLAEGTPDGPVQPVAHLASPSEADLTAAVSWWLHGEARKLITKAVPDDVETLVENLNGDEADLSGPEGLDFADRRLHPLLRTFGFDNPPPPLRHFVVSLLRDAMVEIVQPRRPRSGRRRIPFRARRLGWR